MRILLAATIAIMATFANAASVSIAWDVPIETNNVAGYIIHYGPASGDYTGTVDVGNVLSGRVDNVSGEDNSYYAISAYSEFGVQSGYSIELMWDVERAQLVPARPRNPHFIERLVAWFKRWFGRR